MTEKIIIIVLAIIGSLYPILLNLFRRRSANAPIPENVSDVYDAETYLKWKNYKSEHSRLDLISGIVSMVVTVTLLATNVYFHFASLFPANPFWQVFAVILLDTVVSQVVGVIFSYYSTMVIEQKYGFNKSSIKTFIIDTVRGFIISLLLGMFLAFLMMGLHILLGDYIIILFAVAMFIFSMVLSFLYPYLSRIGNKFTSLEEGELRTKLMELLTGHGYKVRDIKVMDASRRTTKLNAYFSGFGSTKTIVLYDNLVNAMTTDEICAVFAHELGHGLHKDVMKMQIMNIGNLLLMAVAVWFSIRQGNLHEAFGFAQGEAVKYGLVECQMVNYGFAYVLTGIFISLIQPLTSLAINAYSRRAEFRADRQAVTEGYGKPMINALKVLAKENFADLSPSRITVLLEYSHPPLSERIAAVEKQLDNEKD